MADIAAIKGTMTNIILIIIILFIFFKIIILELNKFRNKLICFVSEGADTTELPTASATDSDMESGSLMIDEGEKKKSLKRKSLTTTSNTPVSNICFLMFVQKW